MSKLRAKCPHCGTTLQFDAKHQGTQIRCPKCSQPFVIGSKPQTTVSSHPTPPDNPLDGLDLRDVSAPQTTAGNDGGFWNVPAQQQPQTPPKTAKKKRVTAEMTEQDSQFISAALMMLMLPILATILPFFGFQLKRLLSAGEYAPLGAAILVSVVGGGLIAYARRSSGDSAIAGGGFFAFALFIGFGGFFLQKATLFAEDNPAVEEDQQLAGAPASPRRAPSLRPGAPSLPPSPPPLNLPPAHPGAPTLPPSNSETLSNAERERIAKENAARIADGKRQLESALNENGMQVPPELSGFGSQDEIGSGTSMPEFGSNQAALGSNQAALGSNQAALGSNQANSRAQRIQDGKTVRQSNPDSMMQCARASGEAQVAYSRARMKGQEFGQSYQFISQVGSKSKSGRLFLLDQPVEAICAYEFGLDFAFMPVQESDQFEYQIVPPSSSQLVGFNFSTRDGKLVGIQGIFGVFGDSESSNQVEGEWIGVKTNELGQSICPKPNCGFVQFLEKNEIVGFAWVVKK